MNITVRNPLLRTPLSLIIDDSCPVINKAYYWIQQRHDWRMRHHPDLRMDSRELTPEFLAEQDCVLIVTDHTAVDYRRLVRHSRLVVDTRNALADVPAGAARIVKA